MGLLFIFPTDAAHADLKGSVKWSPPIVPVDISVNTSGEIEVSPRGGVAIPLGPFGSLELGLGYSFRESYRYLTIRVDGKAQKYAIEGKELVVNVEGISGARVTTSSSGDVTVDLRRAPAIERRPQALYFPEPAQDNCTTSRYNFRGCINSAAFTSDLNACLYTLANSCSYWQPVALEELKTRLRRGCSEIQGIDTRCRYVYYTYGPGSMTWQQQANDCMRAAAVLQYCQSSGW